MYYYFKIQVPDTCNTCPQCGETVAELFLLPWKNGCPACCKAKGWVTEQNGKEVICVEDYRNMSWE